MLNKKGAIILAISFYAGLQFSKIYVPEGFERPIFYKIKFVGMELLGFIAKASAILNYGTEPANFKHLIRALVSTNKKTDPLVNTIDKKINGVNVRIYSPSEKPGSKLMPILIFYHGGGFFMNCLNTYDAYIYELVKRLDLVVISVDYRMSPEYPFPIPTTDCYSVTKYVFENSNEFNGDSDRIIMGGDSAGGNVVAVLTQKFLKENRKLPKLQILIYPWMQMLNFNLPSAVRYAKTGLMSKYTLGKTLSWYLGQLKLADELEPLFNTNNHTLLLDDDDVDLKNKLISYVSIDMIPEKYKKGLTYYTDYDQKFAYPAKSKIDGRIKKDKLLVNLIKKTFTPDVSPGLADPDNLIGLPKAYFIVVEWDMLKDESLIYSERLRRAGVDVSVAFYDKTFHGVLTFVEPVIEYQIAHTILNDLVDYIKQNI